MSLASGVRVWILIIGVQMQRAMGMERIAPPPAPARGASRTGPCTAVSAGELHWPGAWAAARHHRGAGGRHLAAPRAYRHIFAHGADGQVHMQGAHGGRHAGQVGGVPDASAGGRRGVRERRVGCRPIQGGGKEGVPGGHEGLFRHEAPAHPHQRRSGRQLQHGCGARGWSRRRAALSVGRRARDSVPDVAAEGGGRPASFHAGGV
mmetsp:Transcript_8260/g.21187  ORF Transcript_8260/g.21187 Transcript_8260/m.21187 type:complete len:206 (+) Transcript_8260:726-1343(+)